MRAGEVMEPLPSARLDDVLLPMVRMVCGQGLPGLVVVDEDGRVMTCLSTIDLVRLVLPGYLNGQPALARVFDERSADQNCAIWVDSPVRAVVGEPARPIPVVRPRATIIEVAELMTRQNCALVVVRAEDGADLGVVTANRVLGAFLAAAGNLSR